MSGGLQVGMTNLRQDKPQKITKNIMNRAFDYLIIFSKDFAHEPT